jgi:hypothetical protein
LIKAGTNVNNNISSGKTAYVNFLPSNEFLKMKFRLMVAANAGFSKACVMLIENGANVYSIDRKGKQKFN